MSLVFNLCVNICMCSDLDSWIKCVAINRLAPTPPLVRWNISSVNILVKYISPQNTCKPPQTTIISATTWVSKHTQFMSCNIIILWNLLFLFTKQEVSRLYFTCFMPWCQDTLDQQDLILELYIIASHFPVTRPLLQLLNGRKEPVPVFQITNRQWLRLKLANFFLQQPLKYHKISLLKKIQ